MARRTLTALVGVPLLIGAIWIGFPWLTVLVAILGVLGLLEFYRMAPGLRLPFILPLGAIWAVLIIVSAQFADDWYQYATQVTLGGGLIAALLWLVVNLRKPGFFRAWAYAVAGPTYVGFLLAHALLLRQLDGEPDLGRDWLLFALAGNLRLGHRGLPYGSGPRKTRDGPFHKPREDLGGRFGGNHVGRGHCSSAGCFITIVGILIGRRQRWAWR